MADDRQTQQRVIDAMATLEAAMHALTVELKSWRLELAAQRNMPRRPPEPPDHLLRR